MLLTQNLKTVQNCLTKMPLESNVESKCKNLFSGKRLKNNTNFHPKRLQSLRLLIFVFNLHNYITFFSSVSASAVNFFSRMRFLKFPFCWTSWIAFTNLLYSSSLSFWVCSNRCRNTSCSHSSFFSSSCCTFKRAFAL